MSTKIAIAFIITACFVAGAFLIGLRIGNRKATFQSTQSLQEIGNTNPVAVASNQAGTTNVVTVIRFPFLPRAERALLSTEQRIQWLEQNGEVPGDADDLDWELAQRTSWWGKPLDPNEFWKGRVLWCDDSAKAAAGRRGHVWPPIPENTPEPWRNIDRQTNGVGADPNWKNWKIAAFWGEFIKTHPKPPEHLEVSQSQLANIILERPKILERMKRPSRINPDIIAKSDEFRVSELVREGYPPEAYSPEALSWSYTLQKRQEYQKLLADGNLPDSSAVNRFLERSMVDAQLITAPLTEEQRQAAAAWKVSYLRRLRQEKMDESYINAYLKAWNLSATQVFTDPRP